ncbi:MAG: ATP-binding cassette domain-containing protein [Bacteroidetes bacterium]|nr:ATP-binding cassette domain-containing protein [Bacteroidota bacterium]MCW5894462.1 ATP-binding cassette domain-containing protein [Bacteroidota bacterium]
MPMISVDSVTYRYPGSDCDSLNDVSAAFQSASFAAIMGANGSGKSTLARMLNGLLIPATGNIIVDGMSTADSGSLSAIRRKVGLVFQDPNLQMTSPTVERELAFGLQNLGIPPDEIRSRVEIELESLNLVSRRYSPPSMLSGGEKLRLILSAVLMLQPDYLVLDETTSFLSPASRKQLLTKLIELNNSRRMGIVLITQFLEEAMMADRLAILDRGYLAYHGTPGDTLRKKEWLASLGIFIPAEFRLPV